ncbi:hypothetical protein GE09DRAFT_606120 [Coniochaeta sp. 2T2.1]|nr:hypothetical protein GE09DRAFT_606120 [Coniochaeta sp. 2T2.1]
MQGIPQERPAIRCMCRRTLALPSSSNVACHHTHTINRLPISCRRPKHSELELFISQLLPDTQRLHPSDCATRWLTARRQYYWTLLACCRHGHRSELSPVDASCLLLVKVLPVRGDGSQPPSWLQGYHWPPLRWIALVSALRSVSSSTALPGTMRSHISKLHQASFGFICRVWSYYATLKATCKITRSATGRRNKGRQHIAYSFYRGEYRSNITMRATNIGNGLLRVLHATISVPSSASLERRRVGVMGNWDMTTDASANRQCRHVIHQPPSGAGQSGKCRRVRHTALSIRITGKVAQYP